VSALGARPSSAAELVPKMKSPGVIPELLRCVRRSVLAEAWKNAASAEAEDEHEGDGGQRPSDRLRGPCRAFAIGGEDAAPGAGQRGHVRSAARVGVKAVAADSTPTSLGVTGADPPIPDWDWAIWASTASIAWMRSERSSAERD
jgi:hypothetical protein